jgi:serine phosphatase RsbU (regulator of sigma subunit)
MNASLGIVDLALNSTHDRDSVTTIGLRQAARVLQSAGAAIVFRDGDVWTVTEVVGLARDLVGQHLVANDLASASQALHAAQPIVVADALSDARIAPALLKKHSVGAFLIVPLITRGQVIGALAFTYRRPLKNDYAQLQSEFAAKLARSVALALENARLYDAEHQTAEILRRLLLQPVPTIDGISIGTAFQTALTLERVGGDFFDIFALDDHRCAFFIADVLGKGLQAAGFTEMIRSSVQAFMQFDSSPAVVLERVNQVLLRRLENDRFATATLIVCDSRSGELVCARAGHPLPILCGRDCTPIETPAGLPLGAFTSRYSEQRLTLRPGESIVLYTDGVTEARRGDDFFGDSRLLAALARQTSREPQVLADALLQAVRRFATGGARDDIAIVAFALDERSRAAASPVLTDS